MSESSPEERLEIVVRQIRAAIHASPFALEVGFGSRSFAIKKAGETYRVAVYLDSDQPSPDARDEETIASLEKIMANPALAEEAFPDPEMRSKILPLLQSCRNLARTKEEPKK